MSAEETPSATPSESAPETAQTPQDNLPKNKVTVEDAGTLKKKVTIEVPRERIDAKLNEMFGELGKTALIPGFRVGHAPRRLVEKRFGREVGEDVRNALVGESLQQAVAETKLSTLGEPELALDKIELPDKGSMTYSFEVEVAPEFELPELEGIEVKKPVLEITDQRVDEQIDQWRQGQAKFEPTTETAAAGDVVTADVRISGEGFNEHHVKDHVLRVAPGQVEGLPLVELPTALTGKKVGDSAGVTIKVPEAHPNETWRGKDATVELTLKEVRRRVLPQIDETFAQGAGFESLDQLRAQVRTSLANRLKVETQRMMRDQVCQYLTSKVQFDLPEGVAARHANRVLQRRYVDLLYRGVPREKIDENLTQLQAAAEQQAKADLKLTFVLGKVADKFEIKVEEGEVNSRIAAMANEYNRRPERMKQELEQEGTLGEVEVSIREEKALDALLTKAKVTEVTQEQLEAEAKKAQEEAAAKAAEEAKSNADAQPQRATEGADAEKATLDKEKVQEHSDAPAPEVASAKKPRKKAAKKEESEE